MNEIKVLKEMEQIKAISHPYRINVLRFFEKMEPATTKQISEKLGEPHAKINYHVKTLEKLGILELVEEKIKSGIVEKYYLPVAKTFVVDQWLSNDERISEEKSIETHENITKNYYKLLKSDAYEEKTYYLSGEEVRSLENKIHDTINEFIKDKNDSNREDVKPYEITYFVMEKDRN